MLFYHPKNDCLSDPARARYPLTIKFDLIGKIFKVQLIDNQLKVKLTEGQIEISRAHRQAKSRTTAYYKIFKKVEDVL